MTYLILLAIVSLSLSSIKLGNNFNCDTNLLMARPSLLISNKEVLSCICLATNNNFWCSQELIIWILGALFEQKRFYFDNLVHAIFWTKVLLFYKNPLKMSVLKSKFQNLRNLDKKKNFHHSHKNNSKFTAELKINAVSHQLLGRIIRGTNDMQTHFFKSSAFST